MPEAFNITTDKQNSKYAEELKIDLTQYFKLIEEEMETFLDKNPNVTATDIEMRFKELMGGF